MGTSSLHQFRPCLIRWHVSARHAHAHFPPSIRAAPIHSALGHWQTIRSTTTSVRNTSPCFYLRNIDARPLTHCIGKGFHRFLSPYWRFRVRLAMSSPHLKAVLFDVRLSFHGAAVMYVYPSPRLAGSLCKAHSWQSVTTKSSMASQIITSTARCEPSDRKFGARVLMRDHISIAQHQKGLTRGMAEV
jgi:hypothetical protein